MGLLDEAIREHLELKRRRGADPAEVAREQREALEPISAPARPAEPGEAAAERVLVEDLPTEEHALDADAFDLSGDGEHDVDGPSADAASLARADVLASETPREPEETAELDMSTVLDEGGGAGAPRTGTDAEP